MVEDKMRSEVERAGGGYNWKSIFLFGTLV